MTVEIIKGEAYTVEYNPGTQSISFTGTIRLQTTEEYQPISQLMQQACDQADPAQPVNLDFQQLQFLNSSGINTISRFVIAARKQNTATLKVIGNKDIYWQQKSLTNLQRLWSKVEIEIM